MIGSASTDAPERRDRERARRLPFGVDWFELAEVRGYLSEGEIDHFQVRLKVGFRLEEQGTT